MNRILIVDDDPDICMLLTRFLNKKGFEAMAKHSGKSALDVLKNEKFDVVLLDFRLPDEDGIHLMRKVKIARPEAAIIIITGYSDLRIAVQVMKLGAYDYVTKPLHPDEILGTIKDAIKQKNKPDDKPTAQSAPAQAFVFGESEVSKKIMQHVNLVAPTNMTVIIEGETGTGKEYIANQIHQRSKRKDKPFIAIDCGALTKELAGSELFGHEKGAFTGAVSSKSGSFEFANGGTIFLDEIGNLSYDIQVKLLRVLQERKVSRVGSNKDKNIDVRILTATNEDLKDAVSEGRFREDLYHRINEFSILMPPLRDRKDDIMVFAEHFLEGANKQLGKQIKGFSKDVGNVFKRYPWYGNLREMRNVVKRAVLLCQSDQISSECLPHEIVYHHYEQFEVQEEEGGIKDLKTTTIHAEKNAILKALQETNNNKTKAAEMLKIDRKTLYNKLNEYGIDL